MPAYEESLSLQSVHGSNFEIEEGSDQVVIKNVKVMQMGPLNEGDIRPWVVDETTLQQLENLGNRPNKGVRARFTHGGFLGSHLGRFSNFRRVDDYEVADMKVAQSSFSTPQGNLGGYVISLAKEDPEAFGASIAPELDLEAMRKQEGPVKSIRIKALKAIDVVEEPAATRGGLFEKLKEQPGEVAEHTEATEMNEMADTVSIDMEKVSESAKPYREAFGMQGCQWFLEGKNLVECYQLHKQELEEKVSGLEKQVSELNTQLEAAIAASGEQEELSSVPKKEPTKENLEKDKELQPYLDQGYSMDRARALAAFAKNRVASKN